MRPDTPAQRILIGIGANLPGPGGMPPLETCRAAAALLAELPGLRLLALSRWWETAPLPPLPDAPPYINGVALLEGTIAPEALLGALQGIEARFGRRRSVPNAPRSLDLDILDMGGLLREAPDPVLPHPRLQERRFVLEPLLEVAPAWRHPRLGPAARLLAALPPQGTRPLG
ncbi:MAG: 2-amino-4-hydroxy-6-hydroxymethyldihydropteridine diphosphokinase [Rhodovarius sp.]|nr:2-amino-4-hydroxy-6-hydroxymethyldihydropteridine diphosphokinase [Rhodovarius sp.]